VKRLLLAAAVGLSLVGGSAQARPIDEKGMTIEEVVAWVKAAGYEPKVAKTDSGERYVSTKTKDGRVNFDVDLYDCDDAGRCRALQFTASFDMDEKVTLEKANAWNRANRYVRMYVDADGDPIFQYDANVAPGGTFEALDDDLHVFIGFIPTILQHIGW
jgi:hypothetical protein